MSCTDCFQGSVHEGTPRGKAIKLHGLDTYVTEPADGREAKAIIVIIPEAFGWEFVNTRLVADHYADKGDYKVYVPDFMNGRAAPLWMLTSLVTASETSNPFSKIWNFVKAIAAFIPWIFHNSIGKTYPVVQAFFEALRKEEGSTLPVGAAGFCWGGKHAILLAHGAKIDDKTLIDAAFAGHPSFLKIPDDFDKVTLPLSVAVGDKDNQLKAAQIEPVKKILESKESAKCEMRVYEDATHGFCVRAAIQMKDIATKASEAEDQCIAWFNEQLKIGS